MARVIGPDVSVYQDKLDTPQGIDFVKMRKGSGYVIIRAGQNLWPDTLFKTSWKDAKAAGLPRGSYWFYDSRAEPKKQAEAYVQLLGDDLGELPLFADFEETYNGQYKGWGQWVIFLDRLKELVGGKEIGIYTAYYYWQGNAPNETTNLNDLNYFHQYPLWIANYNTVEPAIPKPWLANEWLFWQYTNAGDGPAYGAESKEIDLNYFSGDTQALVTRFNLPPATGTPGEVTSDGGTIDQTGISYKVTAIALNVREGPDVTYTKIGLLNQNETVEAIIALPDLSWVKIRNSAGLVGWCAGSYLTKVEAPAPPPLETIDQSGIQYKVNTVALNLFDGPGTTYSKVGTLSQNEVLNALVATKDLSWIKVTRPSDNLTGWAEGQSLVKVTSSDGSTIDQTGIQYKVNTAALNVREGPGTTYAKVGLIYQTDTVDGIVALPDLSWIKITRPKDGLTGWCAGSYLTKVTASTPQTIDQTGIRYKVNTAALNLREGPGTNYAKVGLLQQGDILDAIVALPDLSWVQIRRSTDGLTGWCAASYLLKIASPPPLPETIDQTGIKYMVNIVTADVRDGPGTTYNKVGTLNQNEIVDALVATKDLSWIKINRSSDNLTGWVAGQSLSVAPPQPETIDQTGIKYTVNTAPLDLFDGPGTTYNKVGTLNQNEVVDALIATKDLSWIKVNRPSDNLTGWGAGQYLTVVPAGPDTVDQTGIQYQVTASVLNVRSGPGTSYSSIGTLPLGEIVDALVATTDLSWVKIQRSSDGFTGWVSAQYLSKVVVTPPVQSVIWYQVTATSLYVREGAGTSYKSNGYLQQNEVVQWLADSPDNKWIQITRVDGFSGWCSSSYMKKLGETPPATFIQKLFNGVTYSRKTSTTPHPMVAHVLGIDMFSAGLQFLVTPPARQSGPPLCTRTTSQFMSQFGVQIAINGDGFYYQDPATYPPKDYCPDGGDPLWPNGYAASRGTEYSPKKPGQPILYISKANHISFNTLSGSVYNAISGDRMLVEKGKVAAGLDQTATDPRTAIGINSNGRWLILVCVDGREASVGATFVELANLMVSLGVYTAMSLDGGGSSTMVVQGPDNAPHVVNTPVDDNTPGKERAVANHLGIFIKK